LRYNRLDNTPILADPARQRRQPDPQIIRHFLPRSTAGQPVQLRQPMLQDGLRG
jgi:hypothetical protein